MGKKVIFFFIFLFVLSLAFTSAAPPQEPNPDGLSIQFSEIDTIKQNTDHQFNFHTVNATQVLTNETTTCDFDLYRPNGTELFESPLNYNNKNEWFTHVEGGNFTELGQHSYIVSCNTSNQTGFTAFSFDVTYLGDKASSGQSIIYLSLFIFLIFVFIIILLGINQLPGSNQKDEEGKILSITYLKYLRPIGWTLEYFLFIGMLFLTSNIAFGYLGEELFANILFTLFKVSFGLAPVVITVWIIWIYRNMFHDKQMQNMLNRGIFPQGKL